MKKYGAKRLMTFFVAVVTVRNEAHLITTFYNHSSRQETCRRQCCEHVKLRLKSRSWMKIIKIKSGTVSGCDLSLSQRSNCTFSARFSAPRCQPEDAVCTTQLPTNGRTMALTRVEIADFLFLLVCADETRALDPEWLWHRQEACYSHAGRSLGAA